MQPAHQPRRALLCLLSATGPGGGRGDPPPLLLVVAPRHTVDRNGGITQRLQRSLAVRTFPGGTLLGQHSAPHRAGVVDRLLVAVRVARGVGHSCCFGVFAGAGPGTLVACGCCGGSSCCRSSCPRSLHRVTASPVTGQHRMARMADSEIDRAAGLAAARVRAARGSVGLERGPSVVRAAAERVRVECDVAVGQRGDVSLGPSEPPPQRESSLRRTQLGPLPNSSGLAGGSTGPRLLGPAGYGRFSCPLPQRPPLGAQLA